MSQEPQRPAVSPVADSPVGAPELLNRDESTGQSLADYRLLEGPHSRTNEFLTLLRILRDHLRGLRVLHFVGPCVTVFGSARIPESDPYYQMARQMGGAIARLGFTVMTGGGPGIMEAANRGAREVGGRSVGCNIQLPSEQSANPYLDRSVTLRYFSVRKTLLMKYSYAFVVCPGGVGTLDEFFEALTLIQTGKVQNFPIVLMGREYWHELNVLLEKMARLGTISSKDLRLIHTTDSVAEAIQHIETNAIKPFGLTPVVRRYFPWLLERGLIQAKRMADIGQPVPAEHAFATDGQVVAVRGDQLEEEVEVVVFNVGVDERFAVPVHEADVHLAGMEVDSAIELGGGSVILHGDQSMRGRKTPG